MGSPPPPCASLPLHRGVSKNNGKTPPNHPFVHRVWNHDFHHPFLGVKSTYFWVDTHRPAHLVIWSSFLSAMELRDGLAGKKRNLNGDSGHLGEEQRERDCPTRDLLLMAEIRRENPPGMVLDA